MTGPERLLIGVCCAAAVPAFGVIAWVVTRWVFDRLGIDVGPRP